MLTRRHIRIKVLQSIYAFDKINLDDLKKQEKFLVYSMEQMRDLHILMLWMLVNINKYAESQLEKGKKKHLVTQEDLNPNTAFVNNRVIALCSENSDLAAIVAKRKLDLWSLDNEYVSLLYREMRDSDIYKEYMALDNPDFEADRQFVIALFKQIIAPNDKLYDYLEDKRLTWLDDYPLVNTGILKMIRQLNSGGKGVKMIPEIYKNDDDLEFGLALFRKVILKDSELTKAVVDKTPNWDKERIADLDLIMIKMGIAEFLYFPSIPVKVTINEYLEIAKEYSTPKSSIFINGILDKLVNEYRENNTLNKIGRGLR